MNINIYNPYVREELYLMHHGIAGMRWGKRNGPPYPLSAGAHSASEKKAGWQKSLEKGHAGSATRELNRLDKKKATLRYDENTASIKGNKFKKKAEKAESKGNYKKADKLNAKYEKQKSKATDAYKKREELEKRTNSILKEMTKKGYNVYSREIDRNVHTGRYLAKSTLLSIGGSLIGSYAVMPMISVTMVKHQVTGKKYKAKTAGDGKTGKVINQGRNRKADVAKALLMPNVAVARKVTPSIANTDNTLSTSKRKNGRR